MKPKLTKTHWKSALYLLALIAVAPFALEFLIMAEFVGAEFAVTFMLLYLRTWYEDLIQKWWRFKHGLALRIDAILELTLFQPRTYGLTATASCFILVIGGSTLVACSLWLPAMLLSSGFV